MIPKGSPVPSAVTKLKAEPSDREAARKGANFLERAAMLAKGGLFLTTSNGKQITTELPAALLRALHALLKGMGDTGEVLILNAEDELTPEEAAKILGVSRPIVYQRMNTGRLPFREVGTHRRLLAADVVKLKEFEDRRRAATKAISADTEYLEQAARVDAGPAGVTKPSARLRHHLDEVLAAISRHPVSNPRLFGSAGRGEDTEKSDLDILVDADEATTMYDLAELEMELEAILGCKVDVLTRGGLAADVAERVGPDLRPLQ